MCNCIVSPCSSTGVTCVMYVEVNYAVQYSVCFLLLPTVFHLFLAAVTCSARLPWAKKFPITLFNSIFRYSFARSTWTEYNQVLMSSSLPRGMPLSSLLRFHLHG